MRWIVLPLALSMGSSAWAQSGVPDRQIPLSVLTELTVLDNRFEMALSQDCDATRCFSKGCSYVDHAVADRPRSGSLPGLGEDFGPDAVEAQEFLTRASCAFAVEESVAAGDVQALSRRLQTKLSSGWTVVTVSHQRLQPLPEYLQSPHEAPLGEEPELPEDEVVEPEPEPEPEAPAFSPFRELWDALLPHAFWMVALFLGTLAMTILMWAYRRVGKASIEEQMLLAEIANGGGAAPATDPEASEDDGPVDPTDAQRALWAARFEEAGTGTAPPEMQALARELLRARDLPLLAKAVLTFPDRFPAAFPDGSAVAEAKLELAEYLKTVDVDSLPDDDAFFAALNQRALSAAVVSQSDAAIVRALREEFGAAGLASLMGGLDARSAALVFALAPGDTQQELVTLLAPDQLGAVAEMLLVSNRMSASETDYLFEVLDAARNEQPVPARPGDAGISDRGEAFDAAGALSTILEAVNPDRRAALFGTALDRFGGSAPSWYRQILVSDMLFAIGGEDRADLMLGLDIEGLAAWLSLLPGDAASRITQGLPGSLQNSIRSYAGMHSRAKQLALASEGRTALAAGFQRQLGRVGVEFGAVLRSGSQG